MHIENMKSMMECLCNKAKAQLDGDFDGTDAKEMGEVIDMIKDLSEAKYYCKIVDEMEEAKKEEETLAKVGVTDPESVRFYRGGRRYYYDPIIHGMPRYYDDSRYYGDYRGYNRSNRYYMDSGMRSYDGGSSSGGSNGGSSGGSSMGGGSRYYNDNRYSNGRYAPDGNTMRNYTVPYPDMYDPANSFNMNKWRLDDKKSGYNPLESRYDRAKRYYTESKTEHDKGTEEDNNAKLKFLGEFLDATTDDIVDIYDDASSTEQDVIMKKLSTLLSKMKD